jgi:putative inorganic carbon (HCO3(-)) transporter
LPSELNLGLESIAPYVLYVAAIFAFLLSIFWRPIAGIYYLVPLIPLQTVRYFMNQFPLGQSVVDIILLGVAIGVLRRGKWIFPHTPFTVLLSIFAVYSYISLWNGAFFLKADLPVWFNNGRLIEWKNYMSMPLLFFLTTAAIENVKQIRIVVLLMCFAILLLDKSFHNTVSARDFSTFSEDLRDEGSMGYAGVNGLAAFEAQVVPFLLALWGVQKGLLQRVGYIALAFFSAQCLMYSLSRGGYVALLMGWLFLGLVRYRLLLALLVVFLLSWQTVVPNAVRQRVFMTYSEDKGLEHSGQTRVDLWDDAMKVFDNNPILGTGFNTYAYMGRIGTYQDTHNMFIKVLLETGIVGLALFLWLLLKAWWFGLRMSRKASDPLVRALGLGLAGWIVCAAGANFFGDRWSYLQVAGYFWVLLALVTRGHFLETKAEVQAAQVGAPQDLAQEPVLLAS